MSSHELTHEIEISNSLRTLIVNKLSGTNNNNQNKFYFMNMQTLDTILLLVKDKLDDSGYQQMKLWKSGRPGSLGGLTLDGPRTRQISKSLCSAEQRFQFFKLNV